MDRPWLRHYDPGVPETLAPYPEATWLDWVAAAARERPDHPAVSFQGARTSWATLERKSDAFAAALAAHGVRRGDRVALLLPNCPPFLVAELGAWKAGAAVVPLNPLYAGDELARPLADTGAEVAVALTPFYEQLQQVRGRTRLRHVVAVRIRHWLPPLRRLLFVLFKERSGGHRVELRDGDAWLGQWLVPGRPRPEPARPDDVALILMSGGTTGTPKGVVCPHRSLVASAIQTRAWLGEVLSEWQQTLMLPLPLFHAAGGILGQGAILASHNTLLLVPNPRDLDDILRTARRERPTLFGGVPTLYAALLRHPRVQAGTDAFRSVRLCFSGAAPLLAETKKRFEALTGGRIIEAYSLTEAVVAPIVNPVKGENKIGSVGMPASDVGVRTVNVDSGDDLGPGEVGEILVQAPQIMPGYWNAPEETAHALRDHGERGVWLHTGDLGYLDEDGYLFIVDRLKDLMKPGGLQVWPREVEEAIASHPAVAEVGVAGVPDPLRGEVVKAWVVVRPDAAVAVDELRAFCKQRLAPYKVPSLVEFRSELPKTLVGKVLRRALVAEHRAATATG